MKRNKIREDIINKFEYLYDKFSDKKCETVEEAIKLIELIELELLSNEYCPEFILNHSFFNSTELNSLNDFETCKITLRPSVKYVLNSNELKSSFIIVCGDLFVKELIDNLILWVVEYNYFSYLDSNINKLNDAIKSILESIDENHWCLSFNIGEGVLDISDNHIVIGISDLIALTIDNLTLFSEEDYWRILYIDNFKNMLKDCNRPYDIVKAKAEFTDDLGIYSRKSINKLIRKFVKRRIECVRVGVGYFENKDIFALIEKIAISDSEIKDLNLEVGTFKIIENDNPSVVEKKAGLNKILIKYKLMPFEKKTNTFLDVSLCDLI